MTIWFTSDTHAGHGKMATLRGFADIDSMNEGMTVTWNARAIPPH